MNTSANEKRRKPDAIFAQTRIITLENDLENYVQFKLMGLRRLVLKKGVIPHKFDCQLDRKKSSTVLNRPLFLKKKRKLDVENAVNQYSLNKSGTISEEICIDDQNNTIDSEKKDCEMHTIKTNDVGVQVNLKNLRSTRSKKIQCRLSENSTKFKTIACSPIKVNLLESCTTKCLNIKENYCSSSDSSDNNSETSDTSALSSSIESEHSFNFEFEYTNERFKKMAYEVTLHNISSNPKAYIGLSEEWYKCNLIKLISSHIELEERNIFITLMKIKLNDSFRRLGDMFGISESLVCRLFHNTLPKLSAYFKQFIYWPKEKLIEELLPISFRYRYSSVQSIIDCLEIEIPKPSDPIKQALTWSDYKKCNTLKYLISSTPDGFINFISVGFNGRCTDVLIVEKK
ncbi:hypothetical protein ACI65C_003400 [Semiaphis heraclei]